MAVAEQGPFVVVVWKTRSVDVEDCEVASLVVVVVVVVDDLLFCCGSHDCDCAAFVRV